MLFVLSNAKCDQLTCRLASIGILGKERKPGVGRLGWHGNFDTGFERSIISA